MGRVREDMTLEAGESDGLGGLSPLLADSEDEGAVGQGAQGLPRC